MNGRDYDVVVIGGGHNALVAAARLARGGARVALFESRDRLGGFASTESTGGDGQLAGAPLAVDDFGLWRDDLLGELELERHGLVWRRADRLVAQRPGGSDGRAAKSGEGDLVLWCDAERCAEELEREAKGDGEKLRRFLREIASVLEELEELWRRPPELGALGRFVLSPPLLRWCGGSLEELLAVAFGGARARTALAATALRGSRWGPSTLGTGILLLYQLAGTTKRGLRPACRPEGGAGAFAAALERAASEAGVEIRLGSRVEGILLENPSGARAAGLRLAGGAEVSARLVLSGLDRRSTLLDLVGETRLPVQSARRLRHLRQRGVRSRLLAAASGRAEESLRELAHAAAPLLVVDGLEQLERAAEAAKWGRAAERPWLEVSAWAEDSGSGLWAVNAQSAPQEDAAADAWHRVVAAAAGKATAGALAENVASRLPADWERELGAAGGCEHHGDMLPDQLFLLRGTERASGARTEIDGLFLCGSAGHPGGCVTGLPGWHAAQLAARELG